MIRRWTVLLLLAVGAWSPAWAVDPAKHAEIEKLLQTTGALRVGQQMAALFSEKMVAALRAARSDIPPRVLDLLPAEINQLVAENMPALAEGLIVVYDGQFSLEELQDLNRFYTTPLGAKLIETMPAIAEQSMQIGQAWGDSLNPELIRRIRARLARENIAL